MAAITVVAANARVAADIIDQFTAEAAVAVTAGQVIRLNTSGKWILADATVIGNTVGCYVATKSAGAGQGLTGVRQGLFAGLSTGVAVGSPVFLSDTPGGLDTVAGTVSVLVGRVPRTDLLVVALPL
jgi:hypothetical protein